MIDFDDILARMKAGDESAVEELSKHVHKVARVVINPRLQGAAAQWRPLAIQDTLIMLWKNIDKYDTSRPAVPWIGSSARLAVSRVIWEIEKGQRCAQMPELEDDEELDAEALPRDCPEEQLRIQEMEQELHGFAKYRWETGGTRRDYARELGVTNQCIYARWRREKVRFAEVFDVDLAERIRRRIGA